MGIIRRVLLLFSILNSAFSIGYSQSGEWTWMGGDSVSNRNGIFGLQGVPSPTNAPPGRYAAAQWVDTAGNFWIYSGDVNPDDLWRFDPQTVEWTWMKGDSGPYLISPEVINAGKGIYDPPNSPGSLDFGEITWVTPDNHLWLYGGTQGGPVIGDFWQYNPAINQWAFMGHFNQLNYGTQGAGSSTTMPGGRCETNCAWTDANGDLWFFGGDDANYDQRNDLWKYNVSGGIWTWMSGSPNSNDPGMYGVISQPSTTNYPSARCTNMFWKDDAGNFWLCGGTQLSSDSMLQDIWKFNPQNMQWTWVSGTPHSVPVQHGTNCVADPSNNFGPRYENRSNWQMCDDLIVTFAGFTYVGGQHTVYDMWAYKPNENQWIKINSWLPNGSYGKKGVASASNYPSSRVGAVGFKDRQNNLWMFGGQDLFYPSGSWPNDLWKYQLDSTCIKNITCGYSCNLASPLVSANSVCAHDSATVCAPAGYTTYRWNTDNTATGACLKTTGAGNYYVTVTDINGCTAESNHISVTPYTAPPDTITADKTVFCTGDSAQLCATSGFTAYQWNGGITGTGTCVYVNNAGSYHVTATDANGCTTESNPVLLALYPSPVDTITADKIVFCTGDSARLCATSGFTTYNWNEDITGTGTCVYVNNAGSYYVTATDANGCTAESNPVLLALYPSPADTITADKTIFCTGDSAQLCATSGFTTYNWNEDITGTGTCVYVNNAGSYYVTATDANGCTAESSHLFIETYPVPSVAITRQGDTLSSFGEIDYQWIRNGQPIGGATGSVYVAPQPGSYTVQVTDTNGCTTISNPVDITGIENLAEENISIYPNPNSVGSWELGVGNELVGAKLEVIDGEGRIVFNSKLETQNSKLELNVSSGVYYLRITSGVASVVRKLVKL